jgi:hypothetical protein
VFNAFVSLVKYISSFYNLSNCDFLQNAMKDKRTKGQPGDEQLVSDTQIVAEVLKDHSSSSTFLSTMGYKSRSGRSRTSACAEHVQELEERVEQQTREAIAAREMYQQQLIERNK